MIKLFEKPSFLGGIVFLNACQTTFQIVIPNTYVINWSSESIFFLLWFRFCLFYTWSSCLKNHSILIRNRIFERLFAKQIIQNSDSQHLCHQLKLWKHLLFIMVLFLSVFTHDQVVWKLNRSTNRSVTPVHYSKGLKNKIDPRTSYQNNINKPTT